MPDLAAAWNRAPDRPETRWRRFSAALPMRASLVAVGVVWLLGCVWSFQEQSAFAASKGFAFPHLLPLVIDGFAVSMAGVSWAASLDARPAIPARLATVVAVGASSASNGVWAYLRTHHDLVTVVLGVAVPVAANLAFEVLLAELRRQVQRRRGLPPPVAVPYPRLIRLLLAPWQTIRTWRTLVLEITSMDLAVSRPEPAPAPGPAGIAGPAAPAAGPSVEGPSPSAEAAPAVVEPAHRPDGSALTRQPSSPPIAPSAAITPAEPAQPVAVPPPVLVAPPVPAEPAMHPGLAVPAVADAPSSPARPRIQHDTMPIRVPAERAGPEHDPVERVHTEPVLAEQARPEPGSGRLPEPKAPMRPPVERPTAEQPSIQRRTEPAPTPDRQPRPEQRPTRQRDITGSEPDSDRRPTTNAGRRSLDPRVEQLVELIVGSDSGGEELTGESVGKLFSVSERTGRRLLGQAREVVGERTRDGLEPDAELSVIGGR